MGILYFIIALLATTIGSGAGIGGGVIIKPLLDAISSYNLFVIGVLSSATVLVMAVVTTTRCFFQKAAFDRRFIILIIGAIAGGFLGKELFSFAYIRMDSSLLATIQAIIIILLLVIVLFKNILPNWHIKNAVAIVIVGLVLGTMSSFLGIGGGPINVAVLYVLFSMDMKKATTGSIMIILFAQISKILTITFSSGFGAYDYSMLYYMIPGGVLGGFLGVWLKGKLKQKHMEALFYIIVIGVILLNIYNIVQFNI